MAFRRGGLEGLTKAKSCLTQTGGSMTWPVVLIHILFIAVPQIVRNTLKQPEDSITIHEIKNLTTAKIKNQSMSFTGKFEE